MNQGNYDYLSTIQDVSILTSALKMFFRELKEPLIPFETVQPLFDAFQQKNFENINKKVIEKFPQLHKNLLKILFEHLVKVTELENENKMGVSNIGTGLPDWATL